jgi:iron-sulfur cluster assembly accessory protein
VRCAPVLPFHHIATSLPPPTGEGEDSVTPSASVGSVGEPKIRHTLIASRQLVVVHTEAVSSFSWCGASGAWQVKGDDKVFEKDGVAVVVDTMSLGFLQGATIDYSEELIRASFQVVDNPNAESGCGCGASFVAK